MTTHHSMLARLARRYGIEPHYIDELGKPKVSPDRTLRRLLALLGVKAGTPSQVSASLQAATVASWRALLPETIVIRAGSNAAPAIHLPVGRHPRSSLSVTCRIIDEAGSQRIMRIHGPKLKITTTRHVDGVRHIRVALPLPKSIREGYYRLEVDASASLQRWSAQARLIVAPDRCYLPARRVRGSQPDHSGKNTKKAWGIAVQLYGLRTRGNWGIGDFRDLKEFMIWAGRDLGADVVGVNPLHALPPGLISPYSPSSRLFHHPLYINIDSVPDLREDPSLRARIKGPAFRTQLEALRRSPTVEYDRVRALKWPIFERLYQGFRTRHLRRGTARARAFERFARQQGESLRRFSIFQTLQESLMQRGGAKMASWRQWPRSFRRPETAAVQAFAARWKQRVGLFTYLEWLCDVQLQAVRSAGRSAGMSIGLYQDLAVGIDPNGADAWAFQDQTTHGASVGAPPDLFSPNGQNWCLAPLHPERARAHGYEVFIECFRQNMRHGGLLRIDHAMGLFRLFWVPDGAPARDGAYVQYPADDFLGILALESHRHRTIIVGEDLGTVTPEIRRRLMEAGLLSYRLLLFEKSKGGFLSPGKYPPQAMVSVTTHDLPTLRGYWSGRDIEWKDKLGLYPDESFAQRDRQARARDRQALLAALKRAGVLPRGLPADAGGIPALNDELCRAVYAYLARTPSQLLIIPLEDLLGDIETPNLPGASPDRYPVWKMKAGHPESTLDRWRRNVRIRLMAETVGAGRSIRGMERVSARRSSGFANRL